LCNLHVNFVFFFQNGLDILLTFQSRRHPIVNIVIKIIQSHIQTFGDGAKRILIGLHLFLRFFYSGWFINTFRYVQNKVFNVRTILGLTSILYQTSAQSLFIKLWRCFNYWMFLILWLFSPAESSIGKDMIAKVNNIYPNL
jgi:hypothetical protein